MPLNFPTVTKNNISFGPGRLFLGASGTTPLVDVGAIADDGISLELTVETKDITQGSPKLIEFSFVQTQGVMVNLTSIEWNFDNLSYALGAGNTTVSGALETFSWGGEPCMTEVAIHIQHYMCVSGHTLNTYLWTAVSESGTSLPFSNDEHSFEYKWKGLRSATNWAGGTLASDEQLIRIERVL